MLNFNNKNLAQTDTQHKLAPLLLPRCEKKRMIEIIKQQGSATQCLLLLSETQQPEKLISCEREFNLEDIQVTPWTSTASKNKQNRFVSKSKTSAILSTNNDKENKCLRMKGESNNKENGLAKQMITPIREIVIKKKSDATKNSYSSIARYEDFANQIIYAPARQFSQTKKQPYFNELKSSCLVYQNSKACPGVQKKLLKINGKTDKQNETMQLMGSGAPKFQQNYNSVSLQKNSKFFCLQSVNNSNTCSILKQNNGIINGASKHNTIVQQLNNLQLSKQKLVKEFNLEEFQKNSKNIIASKHQILDKQEFLIKQMYSKSNGENVAKVPEYQRIKRKIIQNIQKQSVISASILNQFESKNSKKLLGRYFRHSQQQSKKSKSKLREFSMRNTVNRTQNSDYNYQSNNPLTKHLYQKYRILINKCK